MPRPSTRKRPLPPKPTIRSASTASSSLQMARMPLLALALGGRRRRRPPGLGRVSPDRAERRPARRRLLRHDPGRVHRRLGTQGAELGHAAAGPQRLDARPAATTSACGVDAGTGGFGMAVLAPFLGFVLLFPMLVDPRRRRGRREDADGLRGVGRGVLRHRGDDRGRRAATRSTAWAWCSGRSRSGRSSAGCSAWS